MKPIRVFLNVLIMSLAKSMSYVTFLLKKMLDFLILHRFSFFLIPIVFIISIFSNPISLFTSGIQEKEIVTRAIFAPRDVKYIDTVATETAKKDALESVGDIYIENGKVVENLLGDVDLFFNSLITYQSKVTELNNLRTKSVQQTTPANASVVTTAEYNQLISTYQSEIKNPFNYKKSELAVFFRLNNDASSRLRDTIKREISKIYLSSLTESNVLAKRSEFLSDSSIFLLFDSEAVNLVLSNIRPRIEANSILDVESTKAAKEQAADAVGDVYLSIDKGERIVSANEKISDQQYLKLKALGLTESSLTSGSWKTITPYFLLVMMIFYAYFYKFYRQSYYKLHHFLFVFGSVAVVSSIYNLLEDTLFSFLSLLPVLTLMMLFVIFWNRNLSMFVGTILGFLLFYDDFSSFAMLMIAATFLIILFPKNLIMMEIIFRSLMLGILLFCSDMIFYLSLEDKINMDSSLTYLVSATVASVVTIGLIPLCEKILGIATLLRLSEFADGNHVLLNKLRQNAYGTYAHSLHVRALCDIASEEVGANKLLLSVSAMFHDIGKINMPHMFIENGQSNQSLHDTMDPLESARIITKHVRDGVEMCKEHNLPKQVIDIIASHHSDNVTNFYYKALNLGMDVTKEQFKYPNPTPKTKEQGILLFADSVEAFSRRLLHKPVDVMQAELEEFIYEHIIRKGSLRHCQLTIDEIERIKKAFIEYIPNIVHERSAYVSEKVKDPAP